MTEQPLTHSSRLFCAVCSKESDIVDGRLQCCGSELPVLCSQCGKPTVRSRRAKKFCSAKCRAAYYAEFANPRIRDCCSVKELSERSGVPVADIRRRIRAGEIYAAKLGGVYVVSKFALRSEAKRKPRPKAAPKPAAEPPVYIRPEISRAARAFADERGLSCAGLASVCSFSRTSAFRLLNGTLRASHFEKIKTALPAELAARLSV